MGVIATASCTIVCTVDVGGVTMYYRLQQSTAPAPDRPSAESPSGWTTTEPGYDGTSTNTLYTCPKTTLTDGSFSWGDVSASSSYEAAKTAYNEAQTAKRTATSFITELANGILVHPSGDSTSGWRIADALELLLSGVSHIRAWVAGEGSSAVAKVRVGVVDRLHMLLDATSLRCMDGRGSGDAHSVVELGPDGSRIGYLAEGHVEISPRRLAMMFGSDRLVDVTTNGMTTTIYAGGSTKAASASLTNAEFEALYAHFAENGAEVKFVGSRRYWDMTTHETVTETINDVRVVVGNAITDYTLDHENAVDVDPALHDGYSRQFPVMDTAGNRLSCASGEMAYLFYPNEHGDVYLPPFSQPQPPRLVVDTYLQPLAEVPGAPVAIKAGGVDAVLANGELRISAVARDMGGNVLYAPAGHTHDAATTSAAGLMSAADKAKMARIGTRVTHDNSSGTSVPSATWTSVANIALAPGTWVICGTIRYAAHGTGHRDACITTEAPSTQYQMRQCGAITSAVSGTNTYVNLSCTRLVAEETTYHLYAQQTSGSALTCAGCITAVRVA